MTSPNRNTLPMAVSDGTLEASDALRELDAMGVLRLLKEMCGVPLLTLEMLHDGTSPVARVYAWPGHEFAIKWAPAHAARGLAHEAKVLIALHERGLRSVPEHVADGETRDRRYLVTRFVRGSDLFNTWIGIDMPSGVTRSRASRLRSFGRALRAVEELHVANVRLGDIRPEHIVEHRSDRWGGRVTLLDHASTRVHADWGPVADQPYRGGCEWYAPREVAQAHVHGGLVPLTPQVDVYCLAASLADVVVGTPTYASVVRHLDGQVDQWWKYLAAGANPFLPRLKARWPALADLLEAPLSPDPTDRPTAGELADSIAALAEREDTR